MQIAIVGLAGGGKTTVFNTLTRGHAETGGYGGLQLNVGRRQGARRAARPARRGVQAEEDRPRRRHVRRPPGAARVDGGPRRGRGAAGGAPRPAARLGRADPRRPGVGRAALPHPAGSVEPARDLEQLDLEFIARGPRDGRPAARAAARLRPPRHARRARGERARGGDPGAAQARARGRPADPRRAARRRRGEGDPRLPVPDPEAGPGAAQRRRGGPRGARPALVERIRGGYAHQHAMVDALSAKIEMELGELDRDEAAVFMEELGLAESSPRPRDRAVLPARRA